MPLALRPNEIFSLVLRSDQDDAKREGPRPRFLFRHQTGREQLELADRLDAIEKLKTAREAIEGFFGLLRGVLVGWEHLRDADGAEIPFDAAKLEDVLTYREAQQLVYRVWGGLDEDDRKNSASPSATAPAGSANPAEAGGTA